MASSTITSWQIEGETVETMADLIFLGSKITADGDWNNENSDRLYFGGSKSLRMVTEAMKLQDACSLEEKLWPT